MSSQTLLLTPWMAPERVISWQRAIVLFYLGKVEVLEEYDERVVSPSITLRTPAVVRLRKGAPARAQKRAVSFSRANVFARDGYRCQYCGVRKAAHALNFDHVLPRVRGGKTSWENIVTSCYACNENKGARTPGEAGMTLLRKPQRPTSLPYTPNMLSLRPSADVSPLWENYCRIG